MVSFRVLIACGVALTVLAAAEAGSTEPVPPAKAVQEAQAKLKRLIKEGEDRPSVYETRIELIHALRAFDQCGTHDRVDQELASLTGWLERSAVPVRVNPHVIYNEVGRAAQARAECTEDEVQRKNLHEAALSAFARAREAARQQHDALNEAITLYNAAQSAEAMGDLPRAIALMEEVCAIDREFALDDNYREDYPELIRLKGVHNATQTAPELIEEHLAVLSEDNVRFTFKAVHGEQQRYRSETHEVSVAGGQRQERKTELKYADRVEVKDDLVTFTMQPAESKMDGRDASLVAAEDEPGDLTPQRLIARLLAQPLSYTVKTDGEFVGVNGLDDIRRTVLTKIDAALPSTATQERARARQLIDQLLSDAVINQQVGTEWTTAVSWWIDAELDIGDWYSIDVDAPQAALQGAALKYSYTFKVNRRLACGPADSRKSCVELIIEGSPDRDQFADYLIQFMTQIAGKQPRSQVRWFRERLAEDAELLERHVLVVDPNTLKTYKQLKTKRTYVPASERGGQPKIELETTLVELLHDAPGASASARRSAAPGRK